MADNAARLQRLINDLPDNDKGDSFGEAFELLAEFALRNSEDFSREIDTLETLPDWARRIRNERLPDLGIDRVVTTHEGKTWAIQVKGHHSPNVADIKDHASGFAQMARGIKADRMIWITGGKGLTRNATKVAKMADDKIVVLNRHWLEGAVDEWPETYDELLKRLSIKPQIKEPYVLRADQEDAVSAVVASFRTTDRAQLHMACGAGKTVVSEAISAALGAQVVAFFVPTLGLMRQSIRSWQRQRGNDGMFALAVCSDDSVGRRYNPKRDPDEAKYNVEDIPAEVFHDSAQVAEYIRNKAFASRWTYKPIVVFVTYKSDWIVGDAQRLHGAPEFDFMFLDEAHYLVPVNKTGQRKADGIQARGAGPDDDRFHIAARHRLYATATPRVVAVKLRSKMRKHGIEEAPSMHDGSAIFGPIAYKLTFGEAISRGILSRYRFEILATKSEDLAKMVEVRRKIRTFETGQSLDAQTFAALHAVRQARESGAMRIITYHSTIDAAKMFAELITDELGYAADPVWGDKSAREREDLIGKMKREEGHILCNVAVLNEGVDIPALDAIVFVDPKSSKIDIAQSIGRTLRLSKLKEFGRVILPIALTAEQWETGEFTEQERALAMQTDGPYGRIISVLSTLADHDETVREIIENIKWEEGPRRAQRPFPIDDGIPDTDESIEDDFRDFAARAAAGELRPGETTPIPEGNISFFDSGRIEISASGMSRKALEAFRKGLRLGVVKKAGKGIYATAEDHYLDHCIFGLGLDMETALDVVRRNFEERGIDRYEPAA